jgi:hypothetical protein
VIGVERKFVVTDIFLVYRVHVGGGGVYVRVYVGGKSVQGACWW